MGYKKIRMASPHMLVPKRTRTRRRQHRAEENKIGWMNSLSTDFMFQPSPHDGYRVVVEAVVWVLSYVADESQSFIVSAAQRCMRSVGNPISSSLCEKWRGLRKCINRAIGTIGLSLNQR